MTPDQKAGASGGSGSWAGAQGASSSTGGSSSWGAGSQGGAAPPSQGGGSSWGASPPPQPPPASSSSWSNSGGQQSNQRKVRSAGFPGFPGRRSAGFPGFPGRRRDAITDMSPLRPGSKVLGGQIPDNPWSGEPPSGELPFKDLISSVTPSPSSESRRSGLSSPLTAKRPYPPDISGLPLLPGLVETVKESVTAKPDEDATSRRGLDRPLISGSGGGLSPIGSISKMEGLNDLNAWGNKPPATIKPAIEAFAEAEDPSLASRLGHILRTDSFPLSFSSLKSLVMTSS